jgi:hypothetical protein
MELYSTPPYAFMMYTDLNLYRNSKILNLYVEVWPSGIKKKKKHSSISNINFNSVTLQLSIQCLNILIHFCCSLTIPWTFLHAIYRWHIHLTLRLDENSLDNVGRDMLVCILHTQHKLLQACTTNGSLLHNFNITTLKFNACQLLCILEF